MIITNYSDICKEDSTLRPYQQKAKKEIFESWDEEDNVMFQMPTGTGKTRLFTSIISDINKYSIQRREAVKILIIAHRTELIEQIDKHLDNYHVPHNVIVGGKEKHYKYPVSVASIQTITNVHNIQQAKKLNVQFIIIDEAHHALAKSYKKLWDMYPNAKRLGVTATPWRMNHQSFLDLFDKLVMSMPIKEFIKQGFLAPYKYFSLRDDSYIQKTIDGIELDSFGEYKESSMEEKMDIGSIRAQLLKSYQALAEGKKGIIYAINKAHARHICNEYGNAGYRVVSIDCNTPSGERNDLVKKFKRGEIDIIVNVDIFSEGFDCPDIEFIQLARPTCSLVKYLQQVGRGLRPTANKQNCIILDNVGMYSKFGLPDARRHWNYHFKGKAVVEEPTKYISKGTGKSRFADLSEGTEDMELIQADYEDVEPIADVQNEVSSAVDDFFPLFGVTLRKTTEDEAKKLGGEDKLDEDTGAIYFDLENIHFEYGRGTFDSIYWTKNYRDFPAFWKTKGFYWENSYDAWLDVFKRLGYKIEIVTMPKQEMHNDRITLTGSFEAWSPDEKLSFYMIFEYGEKGYYTSSPSTLYSLSVYSHEAPIEDVVDEPEEEDVVVENELSSAVNGFFPLFGITLGKTTWEQAKDMGYKVQKWENGPSRNMNVEDVDFWDHDGKGIFTSVYWTRDESDFPPLWKSKGFDWVLSYDAWIRVFESLGYGVTVTRKPVRNITSRRNTLTAEFEALSPDGTLNFIFDFNYGENGYLTSSPKTLYSITVNYGELLTGYKDKVQMAPKASVSIEKKIILQAEDVEKLKHAFDKKSTSYKYFWIMAMLDAYKESKVEQVSFRQILIKMVAKAWKYVFMLNGQFSQSDQLPKYLVCLKSITNLHSDSLESEIEDELNKKFDALNINTILNPLLKNVPYRFLSPWIPFTDNDDVMKQSWHQESRCPYELHNDHVVISNLWRKFLIEYYNSIQLLAEYGLESYLKIDQEYKEERDFYNTRYVSLTQLLKGIKRMRRLEIVKQFLDKYNLPSNVEILPSELMVIIPNTSCIIGRDGRKHVNLPGEMWSLKLLDKLLSKENLNDEYDNIELLEEYGLKSYIKIQNDIKSQDIVDTKYLSLSKLLQAINKNKEEKVVKQFLEKYNLYNKREIKPLELMKIMPDPACTIDSDGRRRVILPGNMWSLKVLDKLLSGK